MKQVIDKITNCVTLDDISTKCFYGVVNIGNPEANVKGCSQVKSFSMDKAWYDDVIAGLEKELKEGGLPTDFKFYHVRQYVLSYKRKLCF